jgi:hypothetical protein
VSSRNLLSDPLDPAVVEAFERTYEIHLPAEYRFFLLQVGDGGDGPGLYMRPLGAPFDDSMPWDEGDIYRGPDEPNEFLHNPFPHTGPIYIDPQSATRTTTAGALFLFDQGCALWDLLVVNGECAGQIWLDRLADGQGLYPEIDDDGRPIGFAQHYCRWLEG